MQDHERSTDAQLNDFLLKPEMKAVQASPGPLEEPVSDLPFGSSCTRKIII